MAATVSTIAAPGRVESPKIEIAEQDRPPGRGRPDPGAAVGDLRPLPSRSAVGAMDWLVEAVSIEPGQSSHRPPAPPLTLLRKGRDMQAQPGDWLVVHSHTEGGHPRKAEIISTHAGGAEPYTVRWLEDDHESVVFPGPDAQVVTAADMAALDEAQSERISQVQSTIETANNS